MGTRFGGRRAAAGILVACAAHFVVGADGLAVAIALPSLQRDLGVSPIDGQWVLTAYGLAFGGSLLLGGQLGDGYGRRLLLVAGMGVFAGGSLLASASPSTRACSLRRPRAPATRMATAPPSSSAPRLPRPGWPSRFRAGGARRPLVGVRARAAAAPARQIAPASALRSASTSG